MHDVILLQIGKLMQPEVDEQALKHLFKLLHWPYK